MTINPKHFKSLELTNYGPFPTLQLSPFGNLVEVSGPNGTGKSYIFNAFLAACSGAGIAEEDIYQEAGQAKPNKEATITIEWHDGRRLELTRKSGTTVWLLYQPDGSYERLTGVTDKGVTKKIQDFTGWIPLPVGEKFEFLNLSPLHKPNLLLQDTSSQMILKVVNGLAGGGALEEAARLADSDCRRMAGEISASEARYKELRKQRLQKGLTSLEHSLHLVKQAQATLASIDTVTAALAKAKEAKQAVIDAFSNAHAVSTQVYALSDQLKGVETAKSAYDKTALAIQNLQTVRQTLQATHQRLADNQAATTNAQAEQVAAAAELHEWVQTVPLGARSLCGQCGCITCEVIK